MYFRNTHVFRNALLQIALCCAAFTATAQAGEASLEVKGGDQGPASLAYGGHEYLKTGAPKVSKVVLETITLKDDSTREYAFEEIKDPEPKVESDRATRSLKYAFPWGTVSFGYTPAADRLGIAMTITNTGKQNIANFSVHLLELSQPSQPKECKPAKGQWTNSIDNLAVISATAGDVAVRACAETIYPPLTLGLGNPPDNKTFTYPLIASGGASIAAEGDTFIYPHGLPRIPAGESLTLEFSLRFAPAATPAHEALADLYARFAEYYKPVRPWPDRRPVAMLMASSGHHRTDKNPRGWFNDKSIDITSPEGKAAFKEKALKWAERSVGNLKKINAQGMIFWDIEGEENPHPITYIGDPRLTKEFAPEMDEIADEVFQKFLDADLRTGVCIRPSQVYYDPEKKKWNHNAGNDGLENRGGSHFPELRPKDIPAWQYFPIVERLSAKIKYAQKRWKCTIFYIDTNGNFWPSNPNFKFDWRLVTAWMWKELNKRHPDVLLIPELVRSGPRYHAAMWAYTAPYMELDLKGYGTPAYIQHLLPGAYSVINITDGPFEEKRATLLESVKRGDIMLFHGWWWPKKNDMVLSVYEEAYPDYMKKGPEGALVQ